MDPNCCSWRRRFRSRAPAWRHLRSAASPPSLIELRAVAWLPPGDTLRPEPASKGSLMERDLRGMTIACRYRIERLLARGGMGTTYVAVDERAFDRRVVIKVPDTLRSDDARARFVNEARQIIGLQHPHIVTALDVGTVDSDDTTPFIAMAYMGGGDLGQR